MDGIISEYTSADGMRHLLKIPAVKQALSCVIDQGTITAAMVPQLRKAWSKAGVFKQTFLDLMLIALGPQKGLEHIDVAALLKQNFESDDRQIKNGLVLTPLPVNRMPDQPQEKLRMRGKPPKEFRDKPQEKQDNTIEIDAFLKVFESERTLKLADYEAEDKRKFLVSDEVAFIRVESIGANSGWPDQLKSTIDIKDICFADAKKHRILSYKETQEIFQEMEQIRGARAMLLRAIGSAAEDALPHIMALSILYEQALDELREKIIAANMRFAVGVAVKYQHRGLDLLDLIQQAYMGILRAIEKFEWQREVTFLTYASWWIHQSIMLAVKDQARTIRQPAHVNDKLSQITRAFRDLSQELGGREPTEEELAAKLEWSVGEIKKAGLLLRQRWIYSLDAPVRSHSSRSDSEDTEFGEIMADANAPDPEDLAMKADAHEKICEVLSLLSSREEEIIRRRFGLDGNEPETLEEIAADLGVSRERIRQIEKGALAKLRHPSRKKLLQSFVDNE